MNDRTDSCFNSLTGQASRWPTAAATDGEKGGPNSRHGSGSLHLPAAAIRTQWYTPDVPNGGRRCSEEMSETGALPNGKKRQVGLENQARFMWPTPVSSASSNQQQNPSPSHLDGTHGVNLSVAAVQWPTPMANANTNRQTKPTPSQIKGEHGLNLAMVAVQTSWLTPSASEDAAGSIDGKMQKMLTHQAKETTWATPIARDWRDGAATSENVPTNSILGRQAPRSMKNGKGSSLTLNPLFVEWLMNWPIGWTDCASAVTGLSLWRQRMRSELSRLLLVSKSAQADLFDF
jgi:DNA (cytosine-5)-methyltransferase 1